MTSPSDPWWVSFENRFAGLGIPVERRSASPIERGVTGLFFLWRNAPRNAANTPPAAGAGGAAPAASRNGKGDSVRDERRCGGENGRRKQRAVYGAARLLMRRRAQRDQTPERFVHVL